MRLRKLLITALLVGGCTSSPYVEVVADHCDGTEVSTGANCVQEADNALVMNPENDERDGIMGVTMATATSFDVQGTQAARQRFQMGVPFLRTIPGVGLVTGKVTGIESMGTDRTRVTFERVGLREVIPKIHIRGRRHVRCQQIPDGSGTANVQMNCQSTAVEPGPRWGTPAYYAAERVRVASGSSSLNEDVGESSSELGVRDCTRTFVSSDNVTFSLNRCNLDIEFDADFTMSWGWTALWYLPDQFEMYTVMDAHAEASLLAQFQASYDQDDEVSVSLGSLNIWVGPIPITISGALNLGYELHAGGVATMEAGLTYDKHITAGITWTEGDGVHRIWDVSGAGMEPIGPTVSAEAHLSAGLGLVRRLRLELGFLGSLVPELQLVLKQV